MDDNNILRKITHFWDYSMWVMAMLSLFVLMCETATSSSLQCQFVSCHVVEGYARYMAQDDYH